MYHAWWSQCRRFKSQEFNNHMIMLSHIGILNDHTLEMQDCCSRLPPWTIEDLCNNSNLEDVSIHACHQRSHLDPAMSAAVAFHCLF